MGVCSQGLLFLKIGVPRAQHSGDPARVRRAEPMNGRLQQRWFVGSPARPGLFSTKDSRRMFLGCSMGQRNDENAQAIHWSTSCLCDHVLCFHAPVQVLLKSGRPGPPAGPPVSRRLLPCSSGRQHTGTERGPLTWTAAPPQGN